MSKPKVQTREMWIVTTGDTFASGRAFSFKNEAKDVARNYNAIVKQDRMPWRYRVVCATLTWPTKGEGR